MPVSLFVRDAYQLRHDAVSSGDPDAWADAHDAEADAGGRVVRVPAAWLTDLRKELATISRQTKLTVTVRDAGGEAEARPANGIACYVDWRYAIVDIPAPVIGEHVLVAQLREGVVHDIRGGARVGDPAPWHCNACKKRKVAWLLDTPDGEQTLAGARCLRDLTADPDAEKVARAHLKIAARVDELARCETSGDAVSLDCGTEDFLAFCCSRIRRDGSYLSRTRFHIGSTADRALQALRRVYAGEARPEDHPEPVDRQQAARVLAWLRDDLAARPVLSDYDARLAFAARRPMVGNGDVGVLASAVTAQERDAAAGAARDRAEASDHVGQPGELVHALVDVLRVVERDGRYGRTWVHIMRDADGNELVAYERNPVAERGDRCRIEAKVKSHGEYRGTKNTIVRVDAVMPA